MLQFPKGKRGMNELRVKVIDDSVLMVMDQVILVSPLVY